MNAGLTDSRRRDWHLAPGRGRRRTGRRGTGIRGITMRPAPTVTVTQLSSSGAASYEAQARPGIRLGPGIST